MVLIWYWDSVCIVMEFLWFWHDSGMALVCYWHSNGMVMI